MVILSYGLLHFSHLMCNFGVWLWPATTLHQMSSKSDTSEILPNIVFHQCALWWIHVNKLVRNWILHDANCLWWWDLSQKIAFPAITNFYYSLYSFPCLQIGVISTRWSVIVSSYNTISVDAYIWNILKEEKMNIYIMYCFVWCERQKTQKTQKTQ